MSTWITPAADGGTVTNSAGDDAELPLVDGTNAGLMSPADFSKLGDMPGIEGGSDEPGSPAHGDLWVDTSECPPVLKIYVDDAVCPGDGGWQEIEGDATPKPIEPAPDDGNNSISPTPTGSGTELDPYVLVSGTVDFGDSAQTVETISFSNQKPGSFVQFVDLNAGNNGERFTQPIGVIGADGTWSGKLTFTDTPESGAEKPFTGLLKIGSDSIYYSWTVTVKSAVVVKKPKVLSPEDGAGIGGDISYYAKTSEITSAPITPGEVTLNVQSGVEVGVPENVFDGTNSTKYGVEGGTAVITFTPPISQDKYPNISVTIGASTAANGSYTFNGRTSNTANFPGNGSFSLLDGEVLDEITLNNCSVQGVWYTGGAVPAPSAVTTLNLTNDKAFDSATGDEVGTLSSDFKAGDKVVGEGTVTFADTPAFSTTLYTGANTEQELVTGIDNTQKALIWLKWRSKTSGADFSHFLVDTERGGEYALNSDNSFQNQASVDPYAYVKSFNNNGVELGWVGSINSNTHEYVAWNFRGAPGFFDIVTYEGSSADLSVPHNLGSAPGAIIYKPASDIGNWQVTHKAVVAGNGVEWWQCFCMLNDNRAFSQAPSYVTAEPDADNLYLKGGNYLCEDGKDYVAYVFADTPGKIKCGSHNFINVGTTVNTGFKPGWVLLKAVSGTENWYLFDTARTDDKVLYPNNPNKEDSFSAFTFSDTGFTFSGVGEYSYIAIAEGASGGSFFPEGVLTEDAAGTTMTLTDVKGEWKAGLTAVNQTEATKSAPGADDVVFTLRQAFHHLWHGERMG